MSLNNNFEALSEASQDNSPYFRAEKEEGEPSKPSVIELIIKVIKDVRIAGSSSNIQDALRAIEQLAPAERGRLLVECQSGLKSIRKYQDAQSILEALTAPAERK